MPSFAAITLADAQSTPVAHVFSPSRLETPGGKTIAVYEDRSGGVVVGYWRIRAEMSPRNSNKMFKLRFVLERATLETLSNNTSSGVNPAPQLAYYTTGSIEVWAHERSTLQERKDVRKMLAGMFGATAWSVTSFTDMVDNLEAIY